MALLQHDMESFLPSEIARLVYGYLEEEECPVAAQAFLETSMQLKECLAVAKKGRKFSSKIYGLSLVDFFDLLSEAICFVKENGKSLKETTNMSSRLLSLLHPDCTDVPKEHITETYEESNTTRDSDSIDLEKQQVKNADLPFLKDSIDLENQQVKNADHPKNSLANKSDSQKFNDAEENKDPPSFLFSHQPTHTSEKDGFSPHFIKIKEENDMEECGFELEENHDDDEPMPNIEPEIQILSPDGQLRQDHQQTVNVITNPIMVGRPPQLLCQPYSMVHMVPAYPATAHPSLSTALFMPQQSFPALGPASQPPITLHHAQSILQATRTAVSSSSSTLPTVWPKPKESPSQNHQAPALRTYKRAADYVNTQVGPKDKISKMKQGIYPAAGSVSKLRPIAPKITQSLDNGVKVQVVHTKENPLIDSTPGITKRCLRSRRRFNQKSEQTAAPLFIDIQEICNEN